MAVNPSDLRATPRAHVVWRAAIMQSPGQIQMVKITDISEGGMALVCQNNYSVGQILSIGMEIPAPDNGNRKTQHICKCAVVHTVLSKEGYRLGLRFLEISDVQKGLIKAWVSKFMMPS